MPEPRQAPAPTVPAEQKAREVLNRMGLQTAAAAMTDDELRPLAEVIGAVEQMRRNIVVSASLGDLSQLAAALAAAQGKFDTPRKTETAIVRGKQKPDGTKGADYSYKYSTLDDLIAATRPALSENGLAVIQDCVVKGKEVLTITYVLHKSGQVWRSTPLPMPIGGDKPQDVGGAMTYGRRYSLGATLNVAAEQDTDGPPQDEPGQRRRVDGPEGPAVQSGRRSTGSASRAPAAGKAPTVPENELPPAGAPAPEGQAADKMVGTGDGAHFPGCINKAQIKRLISIARTHGTSDEELRKFLSDGHITATNRIPQDRYEAIVMAVQQGHAKAATEPEAPDDVQP